MVSTRLICSGRKLNPQTVCRNGLCNISTIICPGSLRIHQRHSVSTLLACRTLVNEKGEMGLKEFEKAMRKQVLCRQLWQAADSEILDSKLHPINI